MAYPHNNWADEFGRIRTWLLSENQSLVAHVHFAVTSYNDINHFANDTQRLVFENNWGNNDAIIRVTGNHEDLDNVKSTVVHPHMVVPYEDINRALPLMASGCNQLIFIDASDESSLPYALAVLEIAHFIMNASATKLRVIWLSMFPLDPRLCTMLATFTDSEHNTFPITLFQMPKPEGQMSWEDLHWITYPVTYDEYHKKVAGALAPDYGIIDGTEEYKKTRTVIFYDRKSAFDVSDYSPIVQGLKRLAGDSSVVELGVSKSTDRGSVVAVGFQPRQSLWQLNGARHLVLYKERTMEVYDARVGCVVQTTAQLQRGELMAMVACAFGEGVNPRNVTVHSQLSLAEILSAAKGQEFDEIYQEAFILKAMARYPSLDVGQLVDCFQCDHLRMKKTSQGLNILGLTRPRAYPTGHFDVQLRDERAIKVTRLLDITDDNVAVAVFLAFIDKNTDPVVAAAMVDISVLIMKFHGPYDFLHIARELSNALVPGPFESVLQECRDVPSNVIATGSIWLILGVYRRYGHTHRPGQPILIRRAQHIMTICLPRGERIRDKVDNIEEFMGLSRPVTDDGLRLTHEHVALIQKYMVRAWCQNVCHSAIRDKPVYIWSRCPVKIDPSYGAVTDSYRTSDTFLAFMMKRRGGTYDACIASVIPTGVFLEALEASAISLHQLETIESLDS